MRTNKENETQNDKESGAALVTNIAFSFQGLQPHSFTVGFCDRIRLYFGNRISNGEQQRQIHEEKGQEGENGRINRNWRSNDGYWIFTCHLDRNSCSQRQQPTHGA